MTSLTVACTGLVSRACGRRLNVSSPHTCSHSGVLLPTLPVLQIKSTTLWFPIIAIYILHRDTQGGAESDKGADGHLDHFSQTHKVCHPGNSNPFYRGLQNGNNLIWKQLFMDHTQRQMRVKYNINCVCLAFSDCCHYILPGTPLKRQLVSAHSFWEMYTFSITLPSRAVTSVRVGKNGSFSPALLCCNSSVLISNCTVKVGICSTYRCQRSPLRWARWGFLTSQWQGSFIAALKLSGEQPYRVILGWDLPACRCYVWVLLKLPLMLEVRTHTHAGQLERCDWCSRIDQGGSVLALITSQRTMNIKATALLSWVRSAGQGPRARWGMRGSSQVTLSKGQSLPALTRPAETFCCLSVIQNLEL